MCSRAALTFVSRSQQAMGQRGQHLQDARRPQAGRGAEDSPEQDEEKSRGEPRGGNVGVLLLCSSPASKLLQSDFPFFFAICPRLHTRRPSNSTTRRAPSASEKYFRLSSPLLAFLRFTTLRCRRQKANGRLEGEAGCHCNALAASVSSGCSRDTHLAQMLREISTFIISLAPPSKEYGEEERE